MPESALPSYYRRVDVDERNWVAAGIIVTVMAV
jgi:hypothetical protein